VVVIQYIKDENLKDIPIEEISKLLGHSAIKTTSIYAKIINQKKVSEMAKWNNL
jgi:site-specific recombinase XerD